MTALAMAAGMLPVAIGFGDLGFRAPMAVAVIGGLITSTLLSLLLVPVFSYVDELNEALTRRTYVRSLLGGDLRGGS